MPPISRKRVPGDEHPEAAAVGFGRVGALTLLVATALDLLRVDARTGEVGGSSGLTGHHPTFVAADPHVEGRAWLTTRKGGVFRTDDEGRSWRPSGLDGERLMTVAVAPAAPNRIWAGSEPSRVWRSDDAGTSWEPTAALEDLPSSSGWAFPPRPETHHVRWIGCAPHDPDRLWVAIEAGALVSTRNAGRTWNDRVSEGPHDTHELAVHPDAPAILRVAAGDGYYESLDGGETWERPRTGLEVGYLRSVAVDPGDPHTVIVSAASSPRTAYVAGRSDGRLYRRQGGSWERVTSGFPTLPSTIAPLLIAGRSSGELWASDERGVHGSVDGGRTWAEVARFSRTPDHLRGLALIA